MHYIYSDQMHGSIGACLVTQCLRIRLPVQGTWVRALVWEDLTCRGATKTMRHKHSSNAVFPKRIYNITCRMRKNLIVPTPRPQYIVRAQVPRMRKW